jgi:hypothetical protein
MFTLPASSNRRHVKIWPSRFLLHRRLPKPGAVMACALALGAAGWTCSAVARAEPPKIHVRGTAKIAARASRDQSRGPNELVLSGSLSDDAGQPLALQNVTIRVTREADPRDAKVAEGIRGARGCDRAADRPGNGARGPAAWGVRAAGPPDAPEVIVVTDEEGRFCFRARLDPDRYNAHLSWTGAPKATAASPTAHLVDSAERDLAFDLSRRALLLRFDPTPRVVSLDAPRTTFEAVAIVDDDATPRVAPALSLVLASEKQELGRALSDASGRARFTLEGTKLGAPGPGELRVTFDGDAETARATQTVDIERHVKVAVKIPAAERGELSPQVPEDGIALDAEIVSVAGPVSEGSVEARVGDVIVGAAPVERGIARLTLTFAAQGSEALVRIRYVPASPWFEALGEPTVRVPIRAPGLLSKAPILFAGLAVLVFFLVGRVSGKSTKPEPTRAPKPDAEGRDGKPRLEVVRAAAQGESGWRGRVVDAHEGTPVHNARVWIERGTFEGRSVLASAATDSAGMFELGAVEVVGGEQIGAEARLHARFLQLLPPGGELSIALAQRRRALLARMVEWAKRRGPPFDARPEPTPGHLRRAAAEDFQTVRWADALERAVFGPGEVDAPAEREIEEMEPQEKRQPAEARPPDDGKNKPEARNEKS